MNLNMTTEDYEVTKVDLINRDEPIAVITIKNLKGQHARLEIRLPQFYLDGFMGAIGKRLMISFSGRNIFNAYVVGIKDTETELKRAYCNRKNGIQIGRFISQ